MCGVRKLTHTAYANQRMTLCLKIGKIESKGGIRWSRYVSNHVACFHHTCFYLGVCRCLRQDVVIGNTPLFFSAQGSVVLGSAEKEAESDSIAGARYLNDTPSGCGRFEPCPLVGVLFPLPSDDAVVSTGPLPFPGCR